MFTVLAIVMLFYGQFMPHLTLGLLSIMALYALCFVLMPDSSGCLAWLFVVDLIVLPLLMLTGFLALPAVWNLFH
jgi:hypothetical protein